MIGQADENRNHVVGKRHDKSSPDEQLATANSFDLEKKLIRTGQGEKKWEMKMRCRGESGGARSTGEVAGEGEGGGKEAKGNGVRGEGKVESRRRNREGEGCDKW